jgi:acyl-CoA oxidase
LNDDDAWRAAYVPALASLLATPASSPRESASRLSALARSGLLEFTDLKTRPDRFFLAHRLLVEHGFEQGPGFSIRFTVQFNLFAGTILELGSETHLEELTRMRRDGTLGCFALTERLAGVNSGLVVQTTATYDPTADAFVLRTPHAGATKNWISQGLTATRAVVVADLIVDGASAGPHAFLIALRRDSDAPPSRGITLTDMGTKTTGNDLDNASIAFDDVIIPRSALLDKHCDVRRDDATGRGVYGAKGDGAPASNMERIGQARLSRVCMRWSPAGSRGARRSFF